MKKLWFKAKDYGWGWTPATWEGWAVLLLFVVIEVANFLRLDAASHSASDTLVNFISQSIILTLFLIFVCWKTGEKPEWRWGKNKAIPPTRG